MNFSPKMTEFERFFNPPPTLVRDRNATHMKTKIFQPEIVVKGQEKVRLKALMFLSKI